VGAFRTFGEYPPHYFTKFPTKILEMIKRCTVEAIYQRKASYLSLNLYFFMYVNIVSTLRHSLTLFSSFMFFPQQTSRNMPSPVSTKHSFSSTFYKEGRVPARLGSIEEQKEYIGRVPLFLLSSYFAPPLLSHSERINKKGRLKKKRKAGKKRGYLT